MTARRGLGLGLGLKHKHQHADSSLPARRTGAKRTSPRRENRLKAKLDLDIT